MTQRWLTPCFIIHLQRSALAARHSSKNATIETSLSCHRGGTSPARYRRKFSYQTQDLQLSKLRRMQRRALLPTVPCITHHPRFPDRLCEKCMGRAQSQEAAKSFDPTSPSLRPTEHAPGPSLPVVAIQLSPSPAQLSWQVHPGLFGRPASEVTAEAMVGAAASPLGDNFVPKTLIIIYIALPSGTLAPCVVIPSSNSQHPP